MIGQEEILAYTRIRAWPTVHDLIVHKEFPVTLIGDKYASSRTAIDRWWAEMRGMGADAEHKSKKNRTRRGGRNRGRNAKPTATAKGHTPE